MIYNKDGGKHCHSLAGSGVIRRIAEEVTGKRSEQFTEGLIKRELTMTANVTTGGSGGLGKGARPIWE